MSAGLFAELAAPFAPDRVSWRCGSTNKEKTKGMALAYIDARDVMERLDEVLTPAGWQKSFPHADGKTVCSIGIKVGDEWIWKSDGAGDTDVEAEKGALSDAFKRAAVNWGIGRYLYDLPSPWVEIEAFGNPNKPSYRIKETEHRKLQALLSRDAKAHRAAVVKSEAQPADDKAAAVSPDVRAAYIAECRKTILSFASADDVRDWWNGDDRKKMFEQFDLSEAESTELKNGALERRKVLARQATARSAA
ncbi:Rad52/Rad22 family DNA repair protein [Roseixanthobacter glucoisosaccharinicivorans]|uniref:Rad52/Rad22 family DNA repair protein n=1 Tax=Roseixanthobacter glucoisosaccharinicivorans TaxID=3119923 RepID=UPI003728907D